MGGILNSLKSVAKPPLAWGSHFPTVFLFLKWINAMLKINFLVLILMNTVVHTTLVELPVAEHSLG